MVNWVQVNASGVGDVAVTPWGGLYTAGQNGSVSASHDHGTTWVQIEASGFSRVAVGPDGVLWAVGFNGSLWRYGTPWVHLAGFPPAWTRTTAEGMGDVAVGADGTLWLARSNGTIWFSADRAATFVQVEASGFSRVAVGPDGVLWAVGANGTLWSYQVSRDPKWIKTPASDMNDVGVEADGRLWLAGKNGTIWLSFDQGRHFTQVEASGAQSIAGASALSAVGVANTFERAWAVGGNGTLWYRPQSANGEYLAVPPTPHFTVLYDAVLGQRGVDMATGLTWVTEGVYYKLSELFGGINAAVNPIALAVDYLTDGGNESIGTIDIHTGTDLAQGRYVLAAELGEIFMRSQGAGWNPNDSKGEALSRLLGADAFPVFPSGYLTASSWLNSDRADFVSVNDATDRNNVSTGCAILFLNYLRYQLGHSLEAIIADKNPVLSDVYHNLTGDADGFSAFLELINRHFPPGNLVNLATENPFPLY